MKFGIKIFFISALFFSGSFYAQINEALKEEVQDRLPPAKGKLLERADEFFKSQEFIKALPLYDSLYNQTNNKYLGYLLGICQTFDPETEIYAEDLIENAQPLKEKLADYDYYLGKAYLANDKFDLAIEAFSRFLKNPLSTEIKQEVLHQLQVTKNAKAQSNQSSVAKISNLGKPINSEAMEYGPQFPSDERFMVFTYAGPKSKGGKQSFPGVKSESGIYFEDIYISYKNEDGTFSEPKPIDNLNTNGHDAVMAVSNDGQKLFIYRSTATGNGDIFISRLLGKTWSKPEILKGVNSPQWEGSCCLSPDERFLYFASERKGGFGGRDIWFATLMPDGTYGNVKNIGPSINTEKDEDAPFITADGKTLFFSSNGHNTIGGYDIFRSDLKGGKFSKPFNIGKPVNTTKDDKYYVVSSDGERGYYSSELKGGYGLQDIYMVEPGMFGKPTALVMVVGKVHYDDKPVKAEITIKSKETKRAYSGKYFSNEVSGEYLVNLPRGNNFIINYKYGAEVISKEVNTTMVDSFVNIAISTDFYSKEYLNKLKVDSAQLKSDDVSLSGLSFEEFLKKFGDIGADSLVYKVQIGAYRFIENFNHSKLFGLPMVERKRYADGVVRFAFGNYKTYKEAADKCELAKKKSFKDAFVVAIYKNRRYFLNELIKEGVLKRP